MKYAKPIVIRMDSAAGQGYCGVGTGASSSGCDVGGVADFTCSEGVNPGLTSSCYDGTSAGWCASGTSPEVADIGRCEEGNGPS